MMNLNDDILDQGWIERAQCKGANRDDLTNYFENISEYFTNVQKFQKVYN